MPRLCLKQRCFHCRQPAFSNMCPFCESFFQSLQFKRPNHLYQYRSQIKKCVTQAKFAQDTHAIEIIKKLTLMAISSSVYQYMTQQSYIITAVPSPIRRTFKRQFDLSAIIAHQIALYLNQPYIPLLETTYFEKPRATQIDRNQQPHSNRYRLLKNSLPNQMPLLVIDDISTTGYTLNCATQTLQTVFDQVETVAFAYTPKNQNSG